MLFFPSLSSKVSPTSSTTNLRTSSIKHTYFKHYGNMACVDSIVVGFLMPMLMCLSFGVAVFLTHWIGTAKRRKGKEAQEGLMREKEAFKEREIATSHAAVQRYMEEMEKWKKEAEINRAASDEYKRLLDMNGVTYQRQTMLFGSPESSNAYESLKTTVNN